MVRRFKSHLILGVICLVACSASNEAVKNFDYSKVENYFGKWKIERYQMYRGTIIPEEKAKEQLGKEIIIAPDKFFFFNEETRNVRYVYREISNKVEEGVIPEKTTAFYGYKSDRKEIRTIEVFRGEKEYYSFEVLEPNVGVFPLDGWLFIAKKEKP